MSDYQLQHRIFKKYLLHIDKTRCIVNNIITVPEGKNQLQKQNNRNIDILFINEDEHIANETCILINKLYKQYRHQIVDGMYIVEEERSVVKAEDVGTQYGGIIESFSFQFDKTPFYIKILFNLRKDLENYSRWTGDPDFDNYAKPNIYDILEFTFNGTEFLGDYAQFNEIANFNILY